MGPATGLVAIQKSAAAAVQHVGSDAPSSVATRTARWSPPETVSSARAIPPANQPV